VDKIKKRINAALTQMQLAQNEIDRSIIIGKQVKLDSETLIWLGAIAGIAGKINGMPDAQETE